MREREDQVVSHRRLPVRRSAGGGGGGEVRGQEVFLDGLVGGVEQLDVG